MLSAIRGFFIVIVFGFFIVASAQLPPEIIADKYMIEAEQAQARGDYTAGIKAMEKIIALQKEHNFSMQDEIHFKYAQMAMQVDSFRVAFDAVSKYLLTAGREGEFYREALLLLMEVEKEIEGPPKINTEQTCANKRKRYNCWKELASHPGCYIWAEGDWYHNRVKWSGKCSGQVPVGRGRLSWISDNKRWESGRFRNGKRHGRWRRGFGSRIYMSGEYVGGKKEGMWYTHSTLGDKDKCISRLFRQGVAVSSEETVDMSKCR